MMMSASMGRAVGSGCDDTSEGFLGALQPQPLLKLFLLQLLG